VGISLATVFDAWHCGVTVTDNCLLVASWGRRDGNLPRDGLISQLTWHIAMYVLTNVAITQCDSWLHCFSCSVYCPLASVYVYTTVSHYIIQQSSPADNCPLVALHRLKWHYQKKQRRGTTQKLCYMSHIKYPDPATTRIRPGSNGRVPGSDTWRNSIPVPPLVLTHSSVQLTLYSVKLSYWVETKMERY